ncbi:MAG: DJ-1 family glyoxalase III [Fibrobacterota bacterium]
MNTKKALIIFASGFEEIEGITCVDVLRRAGVDVTVAGLDTPQITAAHNLQVHCDTVLEKCSHTLYDAIILPGGPGTTHLRESEMVLKLVQEHYTNRKLCCAICAAPTVLDTAGILADTVFTAYPGADAAIDAGSSTGRVLEQDGTVITSKGPGTAQLFALKIVENLCGESVAEKLTAALIANH